jgi:hypothetical protein
VTGGSCSRKPEMKERRTGYNHVMNNRPYRRIKWQVRTLLFCAISLIVASMHSGNWYEADGKLCMTCSSEQSPNDLFVQPTSASCPQTICTDTQCSDCCTFVENGTTASRATLPSLPIQFFTAQCVPPVLPLPPVTGSLVPIIFSQANTPPDVIPRSCPARAPPSLL